MNFDANAWETNPVLKKVKTLHREKHLFAQVMAPPKARKLLVMGFRAVGESFELLTRLRWCKKYYVFSPSTRSIYIRSYSLLIHTDQANLVLRYNSWRISSSIPMIRPSRTPFKSSSNTMEQCMTSWSLIPPAKMNTPSFLRFECTFFL